MIHKTALFLWDQPCVKEALRVVYIPKKVLGASLILVGITGFSGCASKHTDRLALERLLAAKQARIEELKVSKADMQRVIDLKNADLERQKQDRMQAGDDRSRGYTAMHADGVLWPPKARACACDVTPETVRHMQRALKQSHHYHGALDGIYGPQTRRAVASYQRANGLAIGGMTFETLQSLGLHPSGKQVVAGSE